MYKNILKDKIKDAINKNQTLSNLISKSYNNINIIDFIIREIDDFLLTKDDIYNFSNFKNLFYERILELNPNRFGNFIRNIINDNPDKDRTYQHILNDIEDKLLEEYTIPREYITKKRSELDIICDHLLTEQRYFELSNLRKFIKDNFRVYDYGSFIKENRDLARKILKSVDEDETNRTYIRLKKLIENNPGYLGIFTYFNKIEKISFNHIKNVYNLIIKFNDILNQLPEPVVNYMRHRLPYKTKDGRTYNSHFERLLDDLVLLEEKHNAKMTADQYPGRLKRGLADNPDFIELVKELVLNKEKYEMYNNFFLRKVSRYQSQQELIDALTKFVFNMEDDDLRDKITGNYSKIVYDDGDLLVIRVMSQEELEKLAPDTSWCIRDSLTYWLDYVGSSTRTVQLMIVDYTKPPTDINSKIGATLSYSDDNYYYFNTAHVKNDRYISENDLNKILEKHNTNLQELYQIGVQMGTNEYYDEEEIEESRYRGW